MIDPLKPIGAFIENTIRPLLGEFKWFFDECEKKGMKLNEDNIKSIVNYISMAHFRTVLFQFLQAVILTLLICATWIICQK